MTLWHIAARGLRFHRRAHLGVLLGAALAAAVLIGALAVGDSVRYSLRQMALARLRGVHLALHNPGRFFREALAEEVSAELTGAPPVVPVALLRSTATAGQRPDGTGGDARANRVQVVGVTDAFWKLGNATPPTLTDADLGEGVALNDHLARALDLKIGDEVLLRVDKPSLLSRDAPLSTIEDATVTLRLPVTAVLSDSAFGRFSLESNQVPPYNAFLSLAALQKAVGVEGRANALLVGAKGNTPAPAPQDATSALWKHWRFADAGLTVRTVWPGGSGPAAVELRTDRVFLEPPVAEAARTAQAGARGILTYFVNELRVGGRATPYSTVAAMVPGGSGPLPPGMRDDETVINQWLADDLGAKPGDTLTLRYWLVGPMRRLEEKTSTFRIRAILPMHGPARDPDLMPDIPGLSDKKDCRDWEPGVPIDLEKIRDKDQAYWSAYRGTPKAFLTLRAGQMIWDNRFGDLTAVRYPGEGSAALAATEACLRQALNPASLGLFFQPVRERALTASAQGIDFGQLFLGLSFFLIASGLLLTALLFGFGVEQRAEETGTLLALGVPARRVRALLLLEGGAVALLASLLGAVLATLYTRAVVRALSSIWSGAVAGSSLSYHAEPATLAGGVIASFLLALATIFLVVRKQARTPARELLAAGSESGSRLLGTPAGLRTGRFLPGILTATVATVLALGLAAGSALRPGGGDAASASGAFFGAGAMVLIAGLAACRALLARWERGAPETPLTGSTLAVRNAARRTGRSLGATALLASGSFLVVAVGANRHDPGADAARRASGTGGFALYGESSLPVYQDLNTEEGRDPYALDPEVLKGTEVLALRLREGDEASCLNLNRAQTPRLLGVAPAALAHRKAFTFAQVMEGGGDAPWNLLSRAEADGAVPVVGDTNTVVWSLGKKLGDTLPYTDDRGNTHRLRIVGVLGNSVLQGALVMSEANFTRLFPGQSGYQVFLIDGPGPAAADAASRELTRGLEDVGLSLTPAADRLAAFSTVENTYLSIFAALGGLGLLLGSAGLGVVVLRNVWERRGELALLRAVGWGRPALHGLIFREHALLLALGLAVGVVAALVAVLPALRHTSEAGIPIFSLALTLLAVLASGFAWVWAATALALRAPLLTALRSE